MDSLPLAGYPIINVIFVYAHSRVAEEEKNVGDA